MQLIKSNINKPFIRAKNNIRNLSSNQLRYANSKKKSKGPPYHSAIVWGQELGRRDKQNKTKVSN